MKELVILFKALKLYAHAGHNLFCGPTFFSDHKMLGKLYEDYDETYDSLVERVIGLYGKDSIDLLQIQISSVDLLKSLPLNVDNKQMFVIILQQEKKVCDHIKKLINVEGVTEGTKNMLADIADKSEQRQYLLKQRVY